MFDVRFDYSFSRFSLSSLFIFVLYVQMILVLSFLFFFHFWFYIDSHCQATIKMLIKLFTQLIFLVLEGLRLISPLSS